MRIGYDLAKTISYATSAREIILSKVLKELQYFISLAVLADAYNYHICGPWYMSVDTMACKPIKTQELPYSMVSFFIIIYAI